MPLGSNLFDSSEARKPGLDDQWRAIILFGRNVASYKFALAHTLLELRPAGGDLLTLDQLAKPFALHVARHLKLEDKQATSTSSAFLAACRRFNAGEITEQQLANESASRGFANVIDAFHVVAGSDVPDRFFMDERGTHKGIRVTDAFSRLLEDAASVDLPTEVEGRWRLVETAWRVGVARSMLVTHDHATGTVQMLDRSGRRAPVTGSRAALNGYQKGRCFYCSAPIAITKGEELADVDHFFPWRLRAGELGAVVDGVWNLVLACRGCNRGVGGKSDRVPALALLERLHARNEHLITSHHPLRETLIMQTGATEATRRAYLLGIDSIAHRSLLHRWQPKH